MKNMGQLFKQAQQMQAKVQALQKELEEREVKKSAGGGAVSVTVNGKQEILKLEVDAEFLKQEEPQAVEQLIQSTINEALKESKDMVSSAMSKVTGGINLPGMMG